MKHTILFLAANPLGTNRVALDREARSIQAELERSGFRDSFVLETRWAAEPLDLLRELRKRKPTVVHFSGHGVADVAHGATAQNRDAVVEADPTAPSAGGLCFQGADGLPQLVSADALGGVFDAAGSSVKLVVLNACYSEPHAAALLTHVDCVVGMRGAIGDAAARSFAVGLYGGLGERESVAAAFKQGCAAIGLEGLPDGERPKLHSRHGIDPARQVLASPLTPPTPGVRRGPSLRWAAGGLTATAAGATFLLARPGPPVLKVDSIVAKRILTSDPEERDSAQAVRVVLKPVVEARPGDLCFAQASESRSFAGTVSDQALKEGRGVFEDSHGCEQDRWDVLVPLAERSHLEAWRGWVRVALRRGDRIFASEPVAVDAVPAQGEVER